MDCRTQISILIGISCIFFGPIIAIKNRWMKFDWLWQCQVITKNYKTSFCRDEKTLVDDLLKEYDKTVRPSSGNGTKVHVSMYLRHISSVNSKDMVRNWYAPRQTWILELGYKYGKLFRTWKVKSPSDKDGMIQGLPTTTLMVKF